MRDSDKVMIQLIANIFSSDFKNALPRMFSSINPNHGYAVDFYLF